MKKTNSRDEAYKNIIKVAKRIAITVLCCIPVLIIFGYLTRNVITQDWLQVICFMLILGVAVLVEEVVSRRKEKRTEVLKDIQKDVFK